MRGMNDSSITRNPEIPWHSTVFDHGERIHSHCGTYRPGEMIVVPNRRQRLQLGSLCRPLPGRIPRLKPRQRLRSP